jgi:hypothetical protein
MPARAPRWSPAPVRIPRRCSTGHRAACPERHAGTGDLVDPEKPVAPHTTAEAQVGSMFINKDGVVWNAPRTSPASCRPSRSISKATSARERVRA